MTATIKYNSAREGIELYFKEGNPDDDVLAHIKAMGYQKAKRGFWYVSDSPELRTFTEQLVKAIEEKKPLPEITPQPSFEPNEANLEDRNFSLVSIYLKNKGKKEFVLFEPSKTLAEGIAGVYAKKKFGKDVTKVNVYPKTYIREARLLFNQGNIIGKFEKEEKTENNDNPYLNKIRLLLIKEANSIQSFIVNNLKGMKKSVVTQREEKYKEIDHLRQLAEESDEKLSAAINTSILPEKILKEAEKSTNTDSENKKSESKDISTEENIPAKEKKKITPILNSNLQLESLNDALWTEKDNEYSVNKIIVLNTAFDQSRLRKALQDELAKLPIDQQLAIGQVFSEKYKSRRPLSEYEKGLVAIGKSGDKRKAVVLSSFIDDIFLDHGILNKQPLVFEYFIKLLSEDKIEPLMKEKNNNDYVAFLKEVVTLAKKHYALDLNDIDENQIKTAFENNESPLDFINWWAEKYDLDSVQPFTLESSEESKEDKNAGLTKKKKSQYDLNKEIESFIDKKDRTGNSFSQEDKNYISQYTGSGGLIKQGAKDKGILYEYYTPDEIVKKMWELAYKYGYHHGEVLEPACGIGRFFKYAPPDAKLIGFETNKYAAKICKILFPNAIINQKPFESNFFSGNVPLKNNFGHIQFDLIIGNPPYGEFSGKYAGMGEKKFTGAKTYDQYFITRGLDLLSPGGLLVFIIPSSFLDNDSSYNKIKGSIALKADLMDAYRLPTSLFETTDIGTDIIVFKRK